MVGLRSFLYVLVLTVLSISVARADLVDEEQASIKTELLSYKYNIRSNHRVTARITKRFKVLNERGRDRVGVQTVEYNSFGESAEIISAKTINGDEVSEVPKKHMVDKELRGTQLSGFDSRRSIVITFPNVEVDSVIYLEYEIKTSDFPYDDTWGRTVALDKSRVDKFELEVESQLPLFYQLLGEEGSIKVEELSPGKKLRFTNSKPINTQLTNEPENFFIHDSHIPGVIVSTARDWSEFGKTIAGRYAKIMEAPLPEFFNKILKDTETYKDPVERLNQITSRLAKKVRYFGDWRRRNGGHIPRSLDEVAKTQFADCKDISTVLAAMLRKIGYKADVALVERAYQTEAYDLNYKIPGQQFNHAITRVQVGENIFWLDATNLIAFAQGIPRDIENRPTFVLYKDGGVLERTRKLKAEEDTTQSERIFTFGNDGEVKVEGVLKLQGVSAYNNRRADSLSAKQNSDWNLVKWAIQGADIISFEVSPYTQSENITSDVEKKFSVLSGSFVSSTNEGPAIPIPATYALEKIASHMPFQRGDIDLRGLSMDQTKLTYKNMKARNLKKLNCTIKSPWVDLKREANAEKGNVVINDTHSFKRPLIYVAETETKEFKTFKDQVRGCFAKKMLIFK